MTIRTRLALIYGAAVVLTVLAVGVLIWWQVGSALRRSLDDVIATRADSVLMSQENSDQVGLQAGDSSAPAGVFVAIFDARGALIDASAGTPAAVTGAGTGLTSGDLQAGAVVYAIKVRRNDSGTVVIAGSSLATVEAALGELARSLLLVGAIAAIASVAGGWSLARLALRPVARLTREAAHIGAADLDRRLPVSRVHDELGALTETLNEMLDRLAEGLHRQRRFVAAASHDLRTPLAALQAELELADDERLDIGALHMSIRAAYADAVRLSELATALLDLAVADADGRALVRIPVLADQLVESAVRRVEPRAQLQGTSIRQEAPVRMVRVDRVRLEQAIANLVANAVAYGPAAGHVDVVARIEPSPLDESGTDEVLIIDVLDRGPGVPDELAARLFEPFQRGANATIPGAGLGLATAAAAVRAHHGSIGVSNREGGGARFWLQVPA
jgi:two-component system sensor histidine kinase TctE